MTAQPRASSSLASWSQSMAVPSPTRAGHACAARPSDSRPGRPPSRRRCAPLELGALQVEGQVGRTAWPLDEAHHFFEESHGRGSSPRRLRIRRARSARPAPCRVRIGRWRKGSLTACQHSICAARAPHSASCGISRPGFFRAGRRCRGDSQRRARGARPGKRRGGRRSRHARSRAARPGSPGGRRSSCRDARRACRAFP
jgi:hypothetical protein